MPLNDFGIITMHRPSNVDFEDVLKPIINLLITDVQSNIKLIWPIHPRTKNAIAKIGMWQQLLECENILLLNPIGYIEMLKLNMLAKIMLTDSGGLQEECCVLGTPCLTLRFNTERPITLFENGGASYLVGNNVDVIKKRFFSVLASNRIPNKPDFWDGNTAERCVKSIIQFNKSAE
jgi:UDP-N-acetylglucosamine 2-epimerase (non-hydrolysing)